MKLLIITQKVDENDQLLGFSINWFHHFTEKFDSIIILCLEKGKFDLPSNVKVISLGKDKGVSKLGQLFNFYKNIWILRKEYDSVFVFMNAIWVVLGSYLWRILSKRVFLWYAHKTITWKHQLAEKFADGIFTSTPEGFRMISKKIMVVGQGIDTDLFKPDISNRPSRLSILSVGRIASIKNYEVLLRSVKILKDRGVDFFLIFIGEPVFQKDLEYEEKLKNMVSEMGLEKSVSFVGKVANKNLPSYYQSSHIFVNLGKTGSLDKTIVEAMASGMTVISSNDAAVKFLPKELVVSGNDPKELADKIEEVANKDLSQELRFYVIENHSLKNLVKKISFHINKDTVKILIAGYPYIRSYYLKTFEYYPDKDNLFFLLPKLWKAKRGRVEFKPSERDDIFKTKGFFYHSNYPIIGGLFKGWMPAFPFYLLKIFKVGRGGLVFTPTEPILLSTLYQAIWSKLFGLKHVIFTWENIDYRKKFKGLNGFVKNIILKLNLFFSDGIVCGNQKAKEIFSKLTSKPLTVIPISGVDSDFCKLEKENKEFNKENYGLKSKIIFSFVGAIGYRKGIHLIIEAMKEARKEIPNVCLIIVGSGEDQKYEKEIEFIAGKENWITKIQWVSHDEVKKILSISDVFLYPSLSHSGWEEQFGYSMAEASLYELPVIATKSGSIEEIVKDGKTGILVAENNVQELRDAMIKLAKNVGLRMEMGKAGREHVVKNFSYEIVADKFYNFFKKI